jgi:1-acyl-sn-glycerol-3-phosphate acyltransferase
MTLELMTMNNTPKVYKILKPILGFIFKLYYNPKIINKEYIPDDGPILIVGNHKHLYDQCLAILATKRYIRYMAKKEYFDNKKVAWFFKSVGCISVDRSRKDTAATNAAIETLKNGGAIGLFPEGTRNKTKLFLLPFKYGAVSMAKKTDAYIVPFGITGDYKFRSKNLRIIFGKPFKVTDMDLESANEKLYKTVEKLMKQGNIMKD